MSALTITAGMVTNEHGNAHDGVISASTVSGGTGPYTVSWTKTASTAVTAPTTAGAKTGLAAGTYVLHVTDAASATTSHTFTIISVVTPKKIKLLGKAGQHRNKKTQN